MKKTISLIPILFLAACSNMNAFDAMDLAASQETEPSQILEHTVRGEDENFTIRDSIPPRRRPQVSEEFGDRPPEKPAQPIDNDVAVRPAPRPDSSEGTVVARPVESTRVDMTGPGVLKPTVYYFAMFNEDSDSCDRDTVLHGAGSKELLKVCAETAKACSLQGSCGVVQEGVKHTFNIIGRFGGQDRYFEIEKAGCRFGYGVKSSCLDPFYTLAADLSIYKPGEVIFVPGVVGTVLPDGSRHSGYFVIRDQGRGIKGTGRFDFFTGTLSWSDSANPFKKLGLGDVNTGIPYFRVGGRTALKVLTHRAYPTLPRKVAVRE